MMVRIPGWWVAAVIATGLVGSAQAGDKPEPKPKNYLITGCPKPSYEICHYWAPQFYRLCHATFGKAGYIYPKDLAPELPLPVYDPLKFPCPPVNPAIMGEHYYRPTREVAATAEEQRKQEEAGKSAEPPAKTEELGYPKEKAPAK
jgi:hypothetical protein